LGFLRTNQRYLPRPTESTSQIVHEYKEKYHSISRTLDDHPAILALVDGDLKMWSRTNPRGHKATFTSEIVLRAILVHQIEGKSLRGTEILLSHNLFLQDFIWIGNRPTPSYSFLDRCLKVIRPETWDQVNEVLTRSMAGQEQIDPSELRVDIFPVSIIPGSYRPSRFVLLTPSRARFSIHAKGS
jgi:hypothetical protein